MVSSKDPAPYVRTRIILLNGFPETQNFDVFSLRNEDTSENIIRTLQEQNARL